MLPYQIHAILNSFAFLSLLIGAYFAKKHRLKLHHAAVYTGAGLLTLGVAYMLYTVGGVPSTHGKLGILVYTYLLLTAASGGLFIRRKIDRGKHRGLAITALLLFLLQLLLGIYSFVL